MDIELLQIVRDKFTFLKEKRESTPTTRTLREISGALRFLLTDGDVKKEPSYFCKVWDELRRITSGDMPDQPTFNTVVLNRLADIPRIREGKSLILANNVNMSDGSGFGQVMQFHGVVSNEEMTKILERMSSVRVRLETYRSSICMILGNVCISRGIIIKYVANKRGETHFNRNRKPKIREENGSIIVNEDFLYHVLDESFDFSGHTPSDNNILIRFGENGNGLHAAILGICDDLLNESEDVAWYISTVDGLFSEMTPLDFR